MDNNNDVRREKADIDLWLGKAKLKVFLKERTCSCGHNSVMHDARGRCVDSRCHCKGYDGQHPLPQA